MGYKRALFGFAGAGGTLEKGVVRYSVAPRLLQPTTLGELDGTTTPRLEQIANEFRRAGFPVALEPRMDAWQKTHEAWVSQSRARSTPSAGTAADCGRRATSSS